jgi:hypothetical protein
MTALELVNDLWHSSSPDSRCSHLDRDWQGCICRSPGCTDDARRLVVDHLSLQRWCLDRERVEKCHFFVQREIIPMDNSNGLTDGGGK